jgi:aerobic C4-dicarboxylate transport protein
MTMSVLMAAGAGVPRKSKPLYKDLSVLVLVAIVVGTVLGAANPSLAVAMQPLGTVFIKMIRAVIGLVIFFTVVSGIGSMQSMGRVGRLGGVALVYFLALSTLALLVGLVVGNLAQPGAGFNVDPATLDPKAVAAYAGEAKKMGVVEFLMNIVPNTVLEAFVKGDILAIVPTIPVAGIALILGIDRIMSEARALMNMIGSGLAAPVLARMQGELDVKRMHAVLDGEIKFEDYRVDRNAPRQV